MNKLFDFFFKLLEAKQYATIFFISLIILFIVAAIFFLLIKLKDAKLKLPNGTEINFSHSKKEKIETSNLDDNLVINSIENIVVEAVKFGEYASIKRRNIFNEQMSYVSGIFSSLRENILKAYKNESHEVNTRTIETVLKDAFDIKIIKKIEATCKKDNLTNTKDFIDIQRTTFVNGLVNSIESYIDNYVVSQTDGFSLSYIDKDFIKVLEKFRKEIEDSAIDSLNYCLVKSRDFWDGMKLKKESFYQKINEQVKIFEKSSAIDSILEGKDWYKENTPANMEL